MASVTPSPPADGGTGTSFGSLTLHHTLGSMGHNGRASRAFQKMRPNVKLSSIPVATATITLLMLSACETTPSQPVSERLDPDTATTVTVIKKPIELIGAGAHGPTGNP